MDVIHLARMRGYHREWCNAPRVEDDVLVLNPFTAIPFRDQFFLNRQWVANASYRWCMPSIGRQLSRAGRENPEIIWSARPGSGVLKKMFPGAFMAVQVVDYYPAFRGDYIKSIEKHDYELADHIFLIGNALVSYLTEELEISRDKISVLGQGVSIEQYEDTQNLPTEYENIDGPKVVWVGVLEKCDPGLFRSSALRLQEMGGSLILIGTEAEWARQLSDELNNVLLLGAKNAKEVPAYLQHADVGLMLYDRNRAEVYRGQNPLKLYEYAAAGLSILSTPHDEFDYLEPPVLQVTEESEIENALREAVQNRDKLRKESLAFAARHSWASVYEKARNKILDSA